MAFLSRFLKKGAPEAPPQPLGGTIGTMRSYMDFLIYDGSRSIAILREAAKRAGLPPGTRLEYLATSKRDQDMILVKY